MRGTCSLFEWRQLIRLISTAGQPLPLLERPSQAKTMCMNLSEMNSKQLSELKARWYNDALKNGAIERLSSIARALGGRVALNWGPKYRFEKDGLTIYVDDYGNYMTVHFQYKLIVSTHNEKLYIPGEWESKVQEWAMSAQVTEEVKDQDREEKEKSKLLDELTLPGAANNSNVHPVFAPILKQFFNEQN